MIKEEIKVFQDTEALSEGFSQFLMKLLEVYPHVNLSLSGGSTPKVIFDYWAEHCKESIPWERISFFWGDERCVPPENKMNNYGMTKEHLFDKIPRLKPKSIYRIHGENESEEEAQWYNKILQRKILQRDNTPCFEIIMLGLGDDGHTVSIFPDQIELWDRPESCVVGKHPESGMERVSITGKVVNNAQYVVFLATGKNKAEKVRDIIKERHLFSEKYPAAKVNPKHGYLYWFLDSEAASLL
ncbi:MULTISPECIES: 6-phosphogluconolactonase [unclassified Dysgonomonas]|uniref:6-phosphogluconolactonase n=1 Tax=unclassified Dysgonomonas TaxID=2630389 RepID=UPI0013E9F64A|nr:MULTISPECIES: 6-phosphogluconolactonase [unclassified Dysgonomonas]